MSTALFTVPILHRAAFAAASATLPPPEAAFFPVGLPASPAEHGADIFLSETALAAEAAAAASLPLSPPEAQAALRDLLSLGQEYARDGLLRRMAAESAAARVQGGGSAAATEAADLAAFAATGSLPGPKVPDWAGSARQAPEPAAVSRALEDCQKVLLLIHSLEERALELLQLEARFREAENGLMAALGEGGQEFSGDPAKQDAAAGAREPLFPVAPWRVMVDAALPFLPEGAALFAVDPVMAADLREAGMLGPLPEDLVPALKSCPPGVLDGLLHAAVPAWRLVGRRQAPLERPWLLREVNVFVARPAGGWTPAPTERGK